MVLPQSAGSMPPSGAGPAPQPGNGGTAAAGAPAPSRPLDLVFIHGFETSTVIGIDADELDTPQPVRLDLTIGKRDMRACATDNIDDTINYAAVHQALHALFRTHRIALLEALAQAVARLVIDEFGADWVRVSLAKPAKFPDVQSVGVLIERWRAD